MNTGTPHSNSQSHFWKNPIVIICLAAAGYWLFTYHSQHLLGWLPYLILFLCPLMHIFMHRSHGDNGHSNHSDAPHNGLHKGEKGK